MRPSTIWIAGSVGGIFGILAVAYLTLSLIAGRRLHGTTAVASEPIVVPSDSASRARGDHLATMWGCRECHGADLSGAVFLDAPVFAYLVAPNLTSGSGGIGGELTAAMWERAIRHGVGYDERNLLIMPSQDLVGFSDEDTAALIAFLQELPPVDRHVTGRRLGPIGRIAAVVDAPSLFPALAIDHTQPHVSRVEAGITAEYGGYLAQLCASCHHPQLTGATSAATENLLAPNLTPHPETGLGSWTRDDFFRAMREGTRPDGTPIDSVMPWYVIAQWSDDEIDALWTYLAGLPARPGTS